MMLWSRTTTDDNRREATPLLYLAFPPIYINLNSVSSSNNNDIVQRTNDKSVRKAVNLSQCLQSYHLSLEPLE